MDRAHDFRFVQQLPRTTLQEVKYQEDVYDKQVLLNETWQYYCHRKEYPATRVQEEHVKWVTETWEEYEARVIRREASITDYFNKVAQRRAAERADADAAAERSALILNTIKDAERERQSKYLPSLHTLLIDFEEQLRLEQLGERVEMGQRHHDGLNVIMESEGKEFTVMEKDRREDMIRVLDYLEEQRRKKEEADRIRREEEERLAELKRQEEERIRREVAEAEQKRREAEEEARRAEKKRKEEERKARIKAERDARAGVKTGGKVDAPPVAAAPNPGLKVLHEGSLVARRKRMESEYDTFLRELRAKAPLVKTSEGLQALMKDVTTRLGEILFGTAVYMATLDGDTLTYVYASANCSDALRAGNIKLDITTTSCPTSLCIRDQKPRLIRQIETESSIKRLTPQSTGNGDFSVVPIPRPSGEVFAVLGSDTLTTNKRQELSKIEAEKYLYETPDDAPGFIPISDLQQSWMVDVASILASVVMQLSLVNLPESKTLVGALRTVTQTVAASLGQGVNCYVSKFNKPDGDQVCVVAQNGNMVGDTVDPASIAPHSILLGRTLTSPKGLAFQLKGVPFEYVPNIQNENRVECYIEDAKRKSECLLLVPITNVHDQTIFVLGVEKDATPGLTEGEITLVLHLADQLRQQITPMVLSGAYKTIAQQCVDFLTAVTKIDNVYISASQKVVRRASSEDLEYIAATPTQRFMVGKTLPVGTGVSHKVMASGKFSHWPDIQQEPTIALLHEGAVKATATGSLLVCPFGSRVGCIYLDTVNGSAGPITQGDIDITSMVAGLLATAFDEIEDPSRRRTGEAEPMCNIENTVDLMHIAFLKKVWLKVTSDVKGISRTDLLEISKYNHPPPLVLTVVSNTLVVLGASVKSVSTWENCRKKVKQSMIDQMLMFDPTVQSKKTDRVRFSHARKAMKGLTVESTRQHGSYPTSCFFAWSLTTIQLKLASDRIRKNVARGDVLMEAGTESTASETAEEETSSTAETDTVEDGPDESGIPDGGEGEEIPPAEN